LAVVGGQARSGRGNFTEVRGEGGARGRGRRWRWWRKHGGERGRRGPTAGTLGLAEEEGRGAAGSHHGLDRGPRRSWWSAANTPRQRWGAPGRQHQGGPAITSREAAALHLPCNQSSAGCWISTTAALQAASEPPAGRSGVGGDAESGLGLSDLGRESVDLIISWMGKTGLS
jgi:hypothetical protein